MQTQIQSIVRKHLEAIRKGIIARMSALGRNASGRSVASLGVVTTADGGYLEGSSSFLVMESGRKGGKVPYDFRSIIAEWTKAKGLSYQSLGSTPEKGLAKLSGAIAYSIMKKGTRLYRDNGYNDIYSTVMEKELEALATDTAGTLELEVDAINGFDLNGEETK